MPKLRGRIDRQQFPAGHDGQVLVLDTASPHGIAWRSGIDRLITDITPELAGDLDCQGFDLTNVGNIGFSAGAGTITGVLDRAYWFGHKSLGFHTLTTLPRSTDNWATAPASWTAEEAEGWSESGGVWTYSGTYPAPSGVRKFRVGYHFVFDGYTTALWWNMLGRITRKPSGGAFAVVPGSVMSSPRYAIYSIFGVYVQRHHVSGECIVSMADGDELSFQYGNFASGAGTFTAGNLQTIDSGISLTITPADITP